MDNTAKTILNIAAGKIHPLDLERVDHYFLVNLDTMYYNAISPAEIEQKWDVWNVGKQIYLCNTNAFEFMERTFITFSQIVCYRFLEHVKMTDVLYFIYLMSTCLEIGGIVDIIVPDYEILAGRILSEIPGGQGFEAANIITTTELLNEPGSPHASIWTEKRVKYFFELEKRFTVENIEKNFEFDGRNIYLRFTAERVA